MWHAPRWVGWPWWCYWQLRMVTMQILWLRLRLCLCVHRRYSGMRRLRRHRRGDLSGRGARNLHLKLLPRPDTSGHREMEKAAARAVDLDLPTSVYTGRADHGHQLHTVPGGYPRTGA